MVRLLRWIKRFLCLNASYFYLNYPDDREISAWPLYLPGKPFRYSAMGIWTPDYGVALCSNSKHSKNQHGPVLVLTVLSLPSCLVINIILWRNLNAEYPTLFSFRQLPDGADFSALWSVAQPRSREPGRAAQRPSSHDFRHRGSFLLRDAHLLRGAEDQHQVGPPRRLHAPLHPRRIPFRLARPQLLRRAHLAHPRLVKDYNTCRGHRIACEGASACVCACVRLCAWVLWRKWDYGWSLIMASPAFSHVVGERGEARSVVQGRERGKERNIRM